MHHIIKFAVIAALALIGSAAQAAEATKGGVPRFADHPETKLSKELVKSPLVPAEWDEDPKLRLLDTVGSHSRANFAGRYFVAVWGCGTACVSGAVIEPRTGKMHPLPSVSGWNDVHKNFRGINFRHNSRLIVLSGERDDKEGDMGEHFYVFENGKVKFLKTIKTDGNFTEPLK
jgi:hypothetical protein